MSAYRLDFQIGDWIKGQYKIVKRIGSGSYGDVFMVETMSGKTYALKILRLWEVLDDLHGQLVKRFRREFETAQLPSEYLVHSYDYDVMEGNPFYTMEFCERGELSDLIGKNLTELPRLAHDVLMGLYALHSEGKVHRDLKPANVLVKKNGRAVLTDFGVVGEKDKKKQITTHNLLNKPKQMFGSIPYMPPEQFELKGGGVTYLPTTDIFSFGVMLYELLTNGLFPFGNLEEPEDVKKYQRNIKKGTWNSEKIQTVQYSQYWIPIIRKCLECDYRNRYQSVLEILEDMQPMIGSISGDVGMQHSRSKIISRLIVTQGENLGATFNLNDILRDRVRRIKVGRGEINDIVLEDNDDAYVSRHHFTLEKSLDGTYWLIRDGQWRKEERRWIPSTNGTYLNSATVSIEGLKLFTGDIITAGEYKLKIE